MKILKRCKREMIQQTIANVKNIAILRGSEKEHNGIRVSV